jgi:hypothetical protein
MTSAYIQALLATMFAMLLVWEWQITRKGRIPGGKLRLTFDVFKSTIDVFVGTAEVLSISISIAAIVLISIKDSIGDGAQIALAHDMAVFSWSAYLFPSVINEMVQTETQKQATRMSVMIICMILYVIMGNMAGVLSVKFDHTSSWEVYCFWDIIPNERKVSLWFISLMGLLCILWFVVFIVVPTALDRFLPNVAGRLRTVRRSIRIYVALSTGLMMWFMLITITVVRQLLMAKSGYETQDSVWSFGQILALGTWLPVVLELYYLFRSKSDIS